MFRLVLSTTYYMGHNFWKKGHEYKITHEEGHPWPQVTMCRNMERGNSNPNNLLTWYHPIVHVKGGSCALVLYFMDSRKVNCQCLPIVLNRISKLSSLIWGMSKGKLTKGMIYNLQVAIWGKSIYNHTFYGPISLFGSLLFEKW